MKIEITKEWCLQMAELECDAEIGAGLLAIDPIFDSDAVPVQTPEEPAVAFGRFVRLMRRNNGLTLEKLADEADVDISDLVGIDADHKQRTSRHLHRFDVTAIRYVAGGTGKHPRAREYVLVL